MTDVLIARLSAAAATEDQPRVRRLLRGMVDRRLDDAIRAADLPPGEWCVRRLDVPVRLDPGRADAAVQSAWAKEIAAALRNLLRHSPPGEQLVHYPRASDALADMLGALAVGDAERAWAWRQLGLLEPGDPGPHAAPGGAVLAALRRRPAEAVPALVVAARLAGVGALHRLFGSTGWGELARLVIVLHRAGGELATPWTEGSGPAALPRTRPLPADEPGPPGRPGPALADEHGRPAWSRPAGTGDGQLIPGLFRPARSGDDQHIGGDAPARLASSIQARSPLAVAFAHARIRPDPATAWAWAVLAVADAEPALFRRPVARSALATLAQGFAETTPAGMAGTAGRPSGSTDTRGIAAGRQVGDHGAGPAVGITPSSAGAPAGGGAGQAPADARARPGEDPAGARARAAAGAQAEGVPTGGLPGTWAPAWPTDWAGLPFFLATAAEAGLPEAVLSDEVLGDQPLSWIFYQLARRLIPAAESADPAFFALAGLVPGDEPQQPQPEETAHLGVHASVWANVTAARLGQAEPDPFAVAERLAARTGSIMAGPGWIEVHLDLGDVDIDVRRAGLDLDPGWVPWLGTVVIFVYE
jgi:hypothetical protein